MPVTTTTKSDKGAEVGRRAVESRAVDLRSRKAAARFTARREVRREPVTGTGSMTVPIATPPDGPGSGRSFLSPTIRVPVTGPFARLEALLCFPLHADRQGASAIPDARIRCLHPFRRGNLVPVLVEQGGEWVREVLPPRRSTVATIASNGYARECEGLSRASSADQSNRRFRYVWRVIARCSSLHNDTDVYAIP